MLDFDILEIIQLVIILVISIAMHEYAHALVSHKLWDPTPKIQWRLTPNPIKHLDPMGSLMMLFMIISHRGIGRWKPVQINPSYYKDPLKWELLVALAGPATNILLAVLWIIVLLIYGRIWWFSLIDLISTQNYIVITFRQLFILVNFSLAIFNLIPIPPLDGFSIIKVVFSWLARQIERYQIYFSLWFLFILLGPGRWIIGNFIFNIWTFLFNLFFWFFSSIIY